MWSHVRKQPHTHTTGILLSLCRRHFHALHTLDYKLGLNRYPITVTLYFHSSNSVRSRFISSNYSVTSFNSHTAYRTLSKYFRNYLSDIPHTATANREHFESNTRGQLGNASAGRRARHGARDRMRPDRIGLCGVRGKCAPTTAPVLIRVTELPLRLQAMHLRNPFLLLYILTTQALKQNCCGINSDPYTNTHTHTLYALA